jgi:tetratricopeptide (TPR) repeat protein
VTTALERAEYAYHRAVFGGDPSNLDSALEDLADDDTPPAQLARGKLLHARFLIEQVRDDAELDCFDRALRGFRADDDHRRQAEALFWQGCYWQVVAGDETRARGALEDAAQMSNDSDDALTRSYALRHLGIAAHNSGDLPTARQLLEESTGLRRDLGFEEGVAANLVGLCYIAAAQGRTEDAVRLADEAETLARHSEADAIRAQAEAARAAARPTSFPSASPGPNPPS